MKRTEQYTDMDIVQRIGKGEHALFEILIRRNNPFLYKIGRSYNYCHEDTQDLMQDAFIEAFTHLAQFENRSSFKTWLIKIMLNKCFQKQKKSSFKNEIAHDTDDKAVPLFSDTYHTDTHTIVMQRELISVIENALERVPADYRMVFSLREVNGLNVQETADVLGISESNVKVRLNRAKTMLRKEVEKTYTPSEIFEFNLIYCDDMVKRVMGKIKDASGLA